MFDTQEIFDGFSEAFACWTPERCLVQANAASLRMMGHYAADALIGEAYGEAITRGE